MRQLVVFGGGDFSGILAQFGRNEIQFQFRINLFFAAPGDALFSLERRERVFVERQPHVVGAAAQRHVVLFRAGKIKQGSAKVFFFEQAYVDLQPVLQREADLVFSMRQRLIDPGKRKDVLGKHVHVLLRRMAIGKRDQQIQVTDGLL